MVLFDSKWWFFSVKDPSFDLKSVRKSSIPFILTIETLKQLKEFNTEELNEWIERIDKSFEAVKGTQF